MDLASLASVDEGSTLELRHPGTGAPLLDDDEKPISITLAGKDSDRYRATQRAISNRLLKQGRKQTPTVEAMEADAVEVLVACTLEWSGVVIDGEPLKCSAANARKIYTDPRCAWIREQVDAFIDDRANFSKASSTN
jgi:hypothetical protein